MDENNLARDLAREYWVANVERVLIERPLPVGILTLFRWHPRTSLELCCYKDSKSTSSVSGPTFQTGAQRASGHGPESGIHGDGNLSHAGNAGDGNIVGARILDNDMCSVGIDTSGDPLHKRGYRNASFSPAQGNDSRFASLLFGWKGNTPFLTPSADGTIAIEAPFMPSILPPSCAASRLKPCRDFPATLDEVKRVSSGIRHDVDMDIRLRIPTPRR